MDSLRTDIGSGRAARYKEEVIPNAGTPVCRQRVPFMYVHCEKTVVCTPLLALKQLTVLLISVGDIAGEFHLVSFVQHRFSIRVNIFIYFPALRFCLM